jgi:hypothetical protein
MYRYEILVPSGSHENDVHSWQKAVSNAKSQLEHSNNRLMNLELAEKYNSKLWLESNTAAEGITKCIQGSNEAIKAKIDDINLKRRLTQENEGTKMIKLMHKRNESLYTAWRIKHQLEEQQKD